MAPRNRRQQALQLSLNNAADDFGNAFGSSEEDEDEQLAAAPPGIFVFITVCSDKSYE